MQVGVTSSRGFSLAPLSLTHYFALHFHSTLQLRRFALWQICSSTHCWRCNQGLSSKTGFRNFISTAARCTFSKSIIEEGVKSTRVMPFSNWFKERAPSIYCLLDAGAELVNPLTSLLGDLDALIITHLIFRMEGPFAEKPNSKLPLPECVSGPPIWEFYSV